MNPQNFAQNTSNTPLFRTYLYTLFSVSLLSMVLIAVANAIIDPYARYELVRSPGFNELKPAAIDQVAIAKFYQVTRVAPKTILLGNSRVDIGLDPLSAHFTREQQPVYNFAIPGTYVGSDFTRLKHANKTGQITHVILGIDFLDFAADPPGTVSNGQASPSVHATWLDGARVYVRDSLATLLSLSASFDSIRTLFSQGNPDAGGMSSQGLNLASQYKKEIRAIGHMALFQDKNLEYVTRLKRQPYSVFNQGTRTSSTWGEFAALLSYCREQGIMVTLYIHPYHADILEIFFAFELWQELESWKIQLLQVIEANYPGTALWDFSIHTEATTEMVPPAGDTKTSMQWYWESGHYRRELGELMLQQMLRNGSKGYGVLLDRETARSTLTNASRALSDYSIEHPETRTRIKQLIGR